MAESKQIVVRPRIACEVTATAVAAARARHGANVLDMLHSRSLPSGTVAPSLTGENVLDEGALRDAINDVVIAVAGRTHDVTVVVPDTAVRTVLLDFDSVPERHSEADAAVRFRLKKSLPFDADKAAVSYHVQRDGLATGEATFRVIAAVMLNSVREEYESAFLAAGCSPGVLLPSTLASLGLVEATEPTLLLKVDESATSVAIVDQDRLLLLRTLEGSGNEQIIPEQLADDIYPSLVYLQDTFGTSVRRILVAGVRNLQELKPVLEAQTEAKVEELIVPGSEGTKGFTGAIGALY